MSQAAYTGATIRQYSETLRHELQQEGSLLLPFVDDQTDYIGEDMLLPIIGKRSGEEVTDPLGETNPTVPKLENRRLIKKHFKDAIILQKRIEDKTLVDPKGKYIQGQKWALGYKQDEEILLQAQGTAQGGITGETSKSFLSSQAIAVGTTGLSMAKIRANLALFNANNVQGHNRKVWAIGSEQLSDMQSIEQFASMDYNAKKTLVDGGVVFFMGFHFILVDNDLLTKSGTTRTTVSWCESGIAFVNHQAVSTKISELPGRHYSTQIYSDIYVSCTRTDEKKVSTVACKEE